MASTLLIKVQEEFTEAANSWHLEKLYIDLASAKGKGLTPVEKKILRGLLCGYSPAEIANAIYQTRTSSSVRVYLSNALYKYIELMRISQTKETIKINHWSRVITLLQEAGYKKNASQYQVNNYLVSSNNKRYDWGEAIDVDIFYGRQKELAQLEEWIVTDRCRLVALLGMGGIGKTALSVRLAQQIHDKFDCSIWRSVRHAPPIQDFLATLIQFLSNDNLNATTLSETLAGRISQLIDCLRGSRCLLILDNVESLLQPNTYTGNLREGYEAYGELFKRLAEVLHQSCLVLTSREKIKVIASIEGSILPARSLAIKGLSEIECHEIIKSKGVSGSEEDWKLLIRGYTGNPLALKIISTTIKELFNGNVSDFLQQNVLVFGEIRELLEEQLNRLSNVEKQVIEWLAINQELVLLPEMVKEKTPSISRLELIEVLSSLARRSLIYRNATSFKLQPIFMEYFNEQQIKHTCQETHYRAIEKEQPKTYQILGKINTSPDANGTESLTGEQYFKGNQSLPDWDDGSW
ncbi:NB-ARC domain-containing protein [Argonema antarcticum]|uniref:NB-ARC domain-containing protein n=1 Tax=Argonema antarcticum TaxID=2942763 RepID=UPI0020111DB7|nr:NB-ARC domain-containing protein [Argonema antarcticum]MCL1470477.1 NACHT domain-containing protein [Argonema antarcticum A004/B2]